jgi:hypothetical protein
MFTLSDIKSEQQSFKKQCRRRTSAAESSVGPSSVTSSAGNNYGSEEKVLVVKMQASDVVVEESRIWRIEKRIEVLTNLIDSGINVDNNKLKRIQCYERLDTLLEELDNDDRGAQLEFDN